MQISITNVHLDLGAGRRGTDMGPSAIHVAGLVPALNEVGHTTADVTSLDIRSRESVEAGSPVTRFLPVVTDVCHRLRDHVERQLNQGRFPLVLGGDHAQAIGTISGLARHYRRRGERIGVLWVDAHTDMNTPETTPSGNIHGMPLACLLGYGVPELVALNGEAPALLPEHVVVLGARQVDPGEARLVNELGVRVYTMSEIDARGMSVCVKEAIERVGHGTAGIHLSFDLDGVDPQDAPGVGTPVPGGLTLRESHLLCEAVARTEAIVGMEMVELNPTLDVRNQTGQLARWLICSALGKKIL